MLQQLNYICLRTARSAESAKSLRMPRTPGARLTGNICMINATLRVTWCLFVALTLCIPGCSDGEPSQPTPASSTRADRDQRSGGEPPSEPESEQEVPESGPETIVDERGFVSVPLISPDDDFRRRVAASRSLEPQARSTTWHERTIRAVPCTLGSGSALGPNAMRTIREIEVVPPHAYVIDGSGNLIRYRLAGTREGDCRWEQDTSFGLDGQLLFEQEARALSANRDGDLFVQLGDFTSVRLREGDEPFRCEALQQGRFVMADALDFGIAFWAGAPLQRISFTEDSCFVSPIRQWQPPLSAISALGWVGDHVILAGSPEEERQSVRAQLIVANADGSDERQLAQPGASEDALNWVQAVASLGDRVVALDSSSRRLHVWNAAGDEAESLALEGLLDLDEVWFADFTVAGDILWIVAAAQRLDDEGEPSGVYEALVYRLGGL